MLVPRAMPGPEVKIDKCSVEVGEPQCSEVILQLPRQKCPSKLVDMYHYSLANSSFLERGSAKMAKNARARNA